MSNGQANVLLVDDHEENLLALQAVLEPLGHRLVPVASATAALKELQDHVHGLFYESLATFGILALGHKESIGFTRFADRYEEVDSDERIYRKVS